MSADRSFVSLCSGIGGLDLGLEWAGWSCLAQVEIDPGCRVVLAYHWPEVPRHDDIQTFPAWWAAQPRRRVDLVCAGFPCQPVSDAGRRKAQADPRWLWPQVAGCVRVLRPRLVLLENVAGLLARGMGEVLGDLAALGYDTQWDCVSAADVGAPHLRRRVFILAHPASGADMADPNGVSIAKPHRPAPQREPPSRRDHPARRGPAVADAHGSGRRADLDQLPAGQPDPCRGGPLADPDGGQPQRPRTPDELGGSQDAGARQGPQWQRDRHAAGSRGQVVADPQGQRRGRFGRLDPGPGPAVGPGRPCRQGGADRDAAEPGMGGGADGLPPRVDRPTDPGRWPAPPGQPPHEWEPPRTIAGRQSGRTARLSRLGNAVVPQVGAVVGRWALDVLDRLDAPADGDALARRVGRAP